MKRLILIGNPNVGKSALFTRLTGVHTTISNYAGTTVTFKEGETVAGGEKVTVIDTPGTYSLEYGNDAEKVAAELAAEGDLVVNVLDATNLERNLLLTMQLLERGRPLVVVLNMADDAAHKGISIDAAELQRLLRVPVIPTCALSGDGIAELARALDTQIGRLNRGGDFPSIRPHAPEEKWMDLGQILRRVQSLQHRRHTFLERLQDISVHPVYGLGFAALLMAVMFLVIRFAAEGLISVALDPLFNTFYLPLMERLRHLLEPVPALQHVLIGTPIDGKIDFEQSLGVLTTGVYVELAVVLPYLAVFYAMLSLLEDIGYLPRLGVVLDSFMHRLGLHGFSVIPILLGFGCNVPGILATRSLETRSQRFIACTLISIGIPCVSLQAMIVKLVGAAGLAHVILVYAFLGGVVFVLGHVLKWSVRGFLPELILEIPPYRRPQLRLMLLKLYHHVRGFLFEATPLIFGGILLMNLLDYLRFFEFLARVTGPVVRVVWGLPETAILPVVMGFLRKDVAAGMLVPLGLSIPQQMTACVLLSVTFPCIATFVVLVQELGWRDTLKTVAIMLVCALGFGGLAHLLFQHVAG